MEITIDEDRLTEEAYAEYLNFLNEYDDACCSCHINPPCHFCTHPGNPANLVEDDTAWEVEQKDVMDITKKFLGG